MCYDPGLPRHDPGGGGTETRHWFCSSCIVKLHQCAICRQQHLLCTFPPPKVTQEDDLSMARISMLAIQNVWASRDHIGGSDTPDVEWLEKLESPTPRRHASTRIKLEAEVMHFIY